eukprot:929401-Alexandrium_andersonii.AAC.1
MLTAASGADSGSQRLLCQCCCPSGPTRTMAHSPWARADHPPRRLSGAPSSESPLPSASLARAGPRRAIMLAGA